MMTEEIRRTTNKNQEEKGSKKREKEKFKGYLDRKKKLKEIEPNMET